jgi:NAD(P)-dependent dehydrogenase (short-subunit alcohol dehydrogenase family)
MSSRTYFITGASRGIGLELVKQLAAKGNIIIASARNPENASELQKLVDNKKVFAVKLDVQSEESVKASVQKVNEISPEGIDVSDDASVYRSS